MYNKFLAIMLCFCVSSMVGCSLFGGSGASADTPVAAGEGPVPASPADSAAASAPANASVKQKLDITAKKLVSNAAKNVTPNKNNKAVSKVGKEYVASYTEVDEGSLSTEVRPATGAAGTYIGVIRYVEYRYECRGKTKADALKAQCEKTRTRRMSELIRYDGKKWTY